MDEQQILRALDGLREMHELCIKDKRLRAEAIVLGLIEKYKALLDEVRRART